MNKISISIRACRKFVLSCIALVFTISAVVLAAACVQTPTPMSQSKSLPKPDIPTTTSYPTVATQEPGVTSVLLVTPEGQSNATVPRPFPTLPKGIIRAEQTLVAPVTGEVPTSLLREIFQDLSERLKIESEKIGIVKAEAVVWNDGSLGCPQPGEFYTQALVNGYWLILEANGVAYDYRASDRGYFFLCQPFSPSVLSTSLPVINDPEKQHTAP